MIMGRLGGGFPRGERYSKCRTFGFEKRIGGIPIKRSFQVFILIVIVASLSGCSLFGSKNKLPAGGETTNNSTASAQITNESTAASQNSMTPNLPEKTTAETNTAGGNANKGGANEQLLQSASVDLNDDGESEQVEAVQITVNAAPDNANEVEGRLKIRSGASEKEITFCTKNAGMSGVLTNLQFEDLDNDGSKDVFIIIPDNGASSLYYYYFIYSYKKDISYSFTSDNELADFISGFSFKHTKGNKLNLSNSKYAFSADLTIEYESDQQQPDDFMSEYVQRAWIEPVSLDIGGESKLALAKAANGKAEIKVPLPVFGLAAVDMIGEIDLYYTVDKSFNPVLSRFEVLDFNETEKIKVGSCEVSK